MSVLNTSKFDHTEKKAFFDGELGMQRYDTVKYRAFDKLTDKQLGFFWRPEEVDVLRDAKDFKELNKHEQHIFTSNLKRQILLDSVQGRAPAEAFNPITSLPELENWITTWTFSETIHSKSYTHIIRNIYSNPSKIFDEMMDIKEIQRHIHRTNRTERSQKKKEWQILIEESTLLHLKSSWQVRECSLQISKLGV